MKDTEARLADARAVDSFGMPDEPGESEEPKPSKEEGKGRKRSSMTRAASIQEDDLELAADAIATALAQDDEARQGQAIGVRACLAGKEHELTATTLEPCGLLELSGLVLRDCVEKERVLRRDAKQKVLLNLLPVLRTLDSEKLERVLDCFKESRHHRGSVLCWEGEERVKKDETDRLNVLILGRAKGLRLLPAEGAASASGSSPPLKSARTPRGPVHQQDVCTLMPGCMINSTSQFLGAPEPLTVVVDSAEAVTLSADHTELVRYMSAGGHGIVEVLTASAKDWGAIIITSDMS